MEKNIIRLKHILDAIERIEFVTGNIEFSEFLEDWIKQDVVIKNFQVIGEATKNVDDKIIQKYPDISWRQAKGMRNILVHEYFGISIKFLWNTVKENLPQFKEGIIKVISDLEEKR